MWTNAQLAASIIAQIQPLVQIQSDLTHALVTVAIREMGSPAPIIMNAIRHGGISKNLGFLRIFSSLEPKV